MDWLHNNASLLSALTSTGMLFIWASYAWLFYQEFRRQRGSLLFIHEAGGADPQSHCLLVNLSKEPLHVLFSLAACGDRLHRLRGKPGEQASTLDVVKQGPLRAGDSLLLGSFDDIIEELGLAAEHDGQDSLDIEIRIAAIHGFREWPVGARRRFRLDFENSRVTPLSERTEQLRSKRQSREVRRWIDDCLDQKLRNTNDTP